MARESNRLSVATIKAAQVGATLEDGGGLRAIVGEHSTSGYTDTRRP